MPSSLPDEPLKPEDPESTDAFLARMRDGVRSALSRLGGALPRAGYPTLTALICSSACAPVVAAALGAGATLTAAIGTLGAIGGNALSELISDRLDRIRSTDARASSDDYTAALTETFADVLRTDAPELAEVRQGVTALLQRTNAFEIVMREAVAEGNQELLAALRPELDALAAASEENKLLLIGMHDLLLGLCRDQAQSLGMQETVREVTGESLGLLVQMFQLVQFIAAGMTAGTEPGRARWEGSPYRGLQPFTAREAPIFFGRTVALAELVTKAKSCVTAGMMIVAGPSGVGKSSLLRAGLAPAVESGLLRDDAGQGPWRVILVDKLGGDPVRALAEELAKHGGPDSGTTRRSLETHPEEAADRIEERRTGADGQRPERVMLIVDQFEELFTLTDPQQRDRFMQMLEAISQSSRAFVVLGVRSDYVDRCMAVPAVRGAAQDQLFRVGPMTREQMRQAATLPATVAGMRVDDRVVEELLEELYGAEDAPRTAGAALPLLSQTMLLLWEHGREDRRLTHEEYVAIGGVRNAVKTAAEKVYGSLDTEARAGAERLFRRLTGAERGKRLVRLTLDWSTLTAHDQRVAEAFLKERLLVADESSIAIAHDVLLDEWDRLREWLEPDLTSRALFTQLEDDAVEWDQNGRDTSFLYRGARLVALETGGIQVWKDRADRGLQPSDLAKAFIDQSRRRNLRVRRVRRVLTGALAGLTALALILAGLSYLQSQELTEQRNRAISQRLAAESAALLGTDGQLAQLLAAAAWELSETDEAHAALVQSINDISIGYVTANLRDVVEAIVAAPDGRHVATIANSGQIVLWSTDNWSSRLLAEDGIGRASSADLEFSPDGRMLAAVTESSVKIWEVSTLEMVAEFESKEALDLAFGPEGHQLAFAREQEVGVWDLATGAMVSVHQLADPSSTIAFDHEGFSLLIATVEGELVRWSLSTGETATEDPFGGVIVDSMWMSGSNPNTGLACGDYACLSLGADGEWASLESPRVGVGLAIAPDGSAIVAVDSKRIGLLEPETDHWMEYDFPGLDSYGAAVIPGSGVVAIATTAGIQLLDPGRIEQSAPAPVRLDALAGSDSLEAAAAVERIVSYGSATAIWEIASGQGTVIEQVGPTLDAAHGGEISADGTIVASYSTYATSEGFKDELTINDVATGEALPAPATDGLAIEWIEFSPVDDLLAVLVSIAHTNGMEGEEIWLWDYSDDEIAVRIIEPGRDAASLAFSPDGTQLASADGAGVVSLWDTNDGSLIDERDVGLSYPDLTYSTGGDKIAATSHVGLRLWDLTTGAVDEIETGPISKGLQFSPDDKYGVFVGNDEIFAQTIVGNRKVHVWDFERSQLAAIIPTVSDSYHAFFMAGSWGLIAGGSDKVQLLDMSFLADPRAAVCEQAARRLTEEEWETYVPELDYEEITICP